ncbi:hypothetical protein PC110_g2070 [Phytophthora cactorum]|uniref:Uncharacterized protein n=1 Tax=Phytophthora cactorum TaxID=29920 RepID=A0A329T0A1_9STRA|nr:hypothetical protein PC110_g2070 [Phytophthora cactorum]
MFALVRSKGLMRAAMGVRAASTAVARLPHKEALRSVTQDIRWSFKELNASVDELANGFLDLQFERGDVVAVKASGLVFEPKQAGRNQIEIVQGLFPELATFRERMEVFRPKNFRHLHSVITTSWEPVEGMINLNGMMVNSPEPYAMKAVTKTLNDKTPLAVTYSKVEGQNPKKSAVLTHGDLLKRAETLAKSLNLTATDKILLTGEETGLSLGPLAAIGQSAQVVLPSSEFSHEAVQQAMKVENCSIVGSGLENFKRV